MLIVSGPQSANFSIYYSPRNLVYGENITFWGEITWPRKFSGGYLIGTIWLHGERIYKGTYIQDCKPIWKDVCIPRAGDYIRFTKRELPLIMKYNKKHVLPEFIEAGKYKLRADLYDNSNILFACAEIEVLLK